MSKLALVADTRPTKKFVVDGITKDITVEACIFDLIDNSIDAFQENASGLPHDYKSYCIEIEITPQRFLIQDYGKGISLDVLTSNALRFGSHSNHHATSIGFYGIGLNRALLKIGKKSTVTTETVLERSQLILETDKFIKNDNNWNIPITLLEITRVTGTNIEITNLYPEVQENFSDPVWISSLSDNISKRYTEFLNKNLIIKINSIEIKGYSIKIKKTGGFKPLKKEFISKDITVIIELGQHTNHLFPYEKKENTLHINPTREECGWNVFCNDRTVKLFDWSTDTGWETKVHSEHNGFIGKVYFVGNSGKLPWNTSKTDIDLNNIVYKEAIIFMKDYSSLWRKHATKVLKRGHTPIAIDPSGDKDNINSNQPDTISDSISKDEIINDEPHNLKDNSENLSIVDNSLTKNKENTNSNFKNTSNNEFDNFESLNNVETDDDIIEDEPLPSHEELLLFDIPEHALSQNSLFSGYTNGKHPFNIPPSATKLNSIVNEMSKLKLDAKNGFPYATLFLMRSFLELSCKHYISNKKSKIRLGEMNALADQVKACIDHMESIGLFQKDAEDTRDIDALKLLCNTKISQRNIRDIQALQNTLHHPKSLWDKENINAFWYSILPFLIKCYE